MEIARSEVFCEAVAAPGGSCSGNCSLKPFAKWNCAPDGLKYNEIQQITISYSSEDLLSDT